ncbi:MAG: quercetin 2,3-dioxygenase [Candidatus Hydrogenedentota bacterium]
MIQVRRAHERGHANYGWLDTYHTFSFGSYIDPAHMNFRALRAMNEDFIAPGKGFGTHAHKDMEIVTYVIEGELRHRDSMGNGSILRAGDFQRMSAGTGVKHSEFNASPEAPLHLYQIWLLPEQDGIAPGYEERQCAHPGTSTNLTLVASRDARHGSLTIHQDVSIYLGRIAAGATVDQAMAPGRCAWLQVIEGSISLDGIELFRSDGAAISGRAAARMTALSDAEVMLFDLA